MTIRVICVHRVGASDTVPTAVLLPVSRGSRRPTTVPPSRTRRASGGGSTRAVSVDSAAESTLGSRATAGSTAAMRCVVGYTSRSPAGSLTAASGHSFRLHNHGGVSRITYREVFAIQAWLWHSFTATCFWWRPRSHCTCQTVSSLPNSATCLGPTHLAGTPC